MACYFPHFYQFFRSLQQNETFFASTLFLRSIVDAIRVCISPLCRRGTPSSTKAGSEKEELAAFTSPSFATIFLRSPAPPPFQPPPSRWYLSPRAAPSLSSDFPHSIFAISTSDIENSQSGSAAWSYSQWHYSVPLSHRPFPRCTLLSSYSLVFPRLPAVEPSLSAGFRPRMRGLVWAQSGSIRRFARWGITTRRTGGHASTCCFACELVLLVCCALIRQAGGSVSILLCPSARRLHWDFLVNVTRW